MLPLDMRYVGMPMAVFQRVFEFAPNTFHIVVIVVVLVVFVVVKKPASHQSRDAKKPRNRRACRKAKKPRSALEDGLTFCDAQSVPPACVGATGGHVLGYSSRPFAAPLAIASCLVSSGWCRLCAPTAAPGRGGGGGGGGGGS